ncbi:MAG: hypothetical protein D6731_17560 [Planctomycetota bacterium]|nr:MAG: hypothetical protein D6731_17560 [Planctomycetota bacterium]
MRTHALTLGLALTSGLALVVSAAPAAAAPRRPSMRWVPAHPSNYTRRSSRTIRRIVIHTIEGSEAAGVSWFQNPRANVSAHFVVAHSGRITQMLRESDRGWHAGVSSVNADSIGIENEGWAYRNTWTEAQYRALADLVRYLIHKYSIPLDRRHIVAHSEVRNGKVDPGPHFNWGKLFRLVGAGAPPVPSSTTTPNTNASTPRVPAGTRTAVEVTASALNVRTRAWGTVLGQATRGERFVVIGQRSGWLRIHWGGRDGWIHGNYARRVASEGVEITASVLNVRNGPSTRYGRLGVCYRGQTFVVVRRQGSWALVQFDGRRGWLHAGYTRSVSLR